MGTTYQYVCPFCGSSVRYIPEYQRWWCDQCRRYITPQQIFMVSRKKRVSYKRIIGIACIILVASIALYWVFTQTPLLITPPALSVSYNAPSEAYLGYDYHISLSVTNDGAPADISIKYVAPDGESTISDRFGDGDSHSYDFLGYSDDVGVFLFEFFVSGENERGSDSKTVSFSVAVKQQPVTIFYDQQEYNQKSGQVTQIIALMKMTYFGGVFALQHIIYSDNPFFSPTYATVAWFVEPDSESVSHMAEDLSSRHTDRVLQAKEFYYFIRDYITYDHEKAEEAGTPVAGFTYFLFSGNAWNQYPVLTLAWEKGVCVDKAILLASLFEAVGFDACIVICSVQSSTANHAYVLVHISYAGIHLHLDGTCKGYSWNEWLCLDPTDTSALFGQQAFSTGETVNAVVDVW